MVTVMKWLFTRIPRLISCNNIHPVFYKLSNSVTTRECAKAVLHSSLPVKQESRSVRTIFSNPIMSDLSVEVSVKQGRLRGVVDENVLGGKYFSFRGIPYATPPVGELRFQDPLPPKQWTGIRDASSHGEICAQHDIITNSIRGGDDCLYLNVYTKTLNAKQPVMVWIHGGGYVFGSGDNQFYGPDFLVARDVVIVTINYRLGVLGFLNLEDEVAPGNQGLKDQVLALKWVQENISNFGGDPKNVTVFGESAGSASVHFLTLSPLAQDLFHKAICQSGVVANPWASFLQKPRYYGFLIAEKLGKKCTDSREVVEFLRTVDAEDIVKVQQNLFKYMEEGRFLPPFAPGMDSKSPNPFMPQSPSTAALTGVRIPLLLGYNSEEGLLFLRGMGDDMWEKINQDIESILSVETKALLRERGLTGADLKRIYFGNETICKENRSRYVLMLGDIQFVCGIHETIGIQVEKRRQPTYFYIYSYDKGISPMKQLMNIDEPGTCHADELRFVFCPGLMQALGMEPYVKGTEDAKVIDYFSELWTNFAKTGDPTPKVTELIPFKWKPVDDSKSYNYLAIGEKLEMRTLQVLEHRSSWKLKNKL